MATTAKPRRTQPADSGYLVAALRRVLADRERELLDLKGPCSNTKCFLHYAHSGPCDTTDDAATGVETAAPDALSAERKRIKRLLSVPMLAALRCVPDGEIRDGCVVYDGAQVRERLRQAWLAVADDRTP